MRSFLVPGFFLSLALPFSVTAQPPALPEASGPAASPSEDSVLRGRSEPSGGASASDARTWHVRLLGGVSRWHWEEDDEEGGRLLTEDGWIPSVEFVFSRAWPGCRLDLAFLAHYGAVDYDGGLQSTSEGRRVDSPWKSHTHYSIVEWEGQIVARKLFAGSPIQPGFRFAAESRVRTIGSESYREPDEHGYVETWTSTSFAPLLELTVRPVGDRELRAQLGLRFFAGNDERVSEVPMYSVDSDGDTAFGRGGFDLRPRPERSFDVRIVGRLGRALLEARYLSESYDESSVNWAYGVLQPVSRLDRVDLRAGWEF